MWAALEKIGLAAAVVVVSTSLTNRSIPWESDVPEPPRLGQAQACLDLPTPEPSAFENPIFRGTAASNASAEAPLAHATSRLPAGPQGFDSWSDDRRAAFQRMLRVSDREPVGAMEIPSLDLLIPIYEGGDEIAMTLGAGRIEATDALDGASNAALEGHRDGYFGALRDIELGEQVHVRTDTVERTYTVTGTRVVPPDAVWVLEPTETPALTLVTQHPFYAAGPANNRFVIRADLVHEQKHLPAGARRIRI